MTWPRPIFSRFAGGPSPIPVVPEISCGAPASGYEQLINGVGCVSPVPPSQRPGAQQLLPPDFPFPASAIGAGSDLLGWTGYTPDWSPSGIVGAALFQFGPIGYRRATHETFVSETVAGYTIWLDPAGNPA